MATDLAGKAEEIGRKLDKLNGAPQWPSNSKEEIRHLPPQWPSKRSVADVLQERERNASGEAATLRDEISILEKKLSDEATEVARLRDEISIRKKKLSDKAFSLAGNGNCHPFYRLDNIFHGT